MVRGLVVLFHLLLCASLATGLAAGLLQLRVNGLWEARFYGDTSVTTAGLARLLGLDLLITALHTAFVAAYALKRPRSATNLVAGSALLMVVVTPSASWALVMSCGVIIIEEIRWRIPIWAALLAERKDSDD